MFKALMILRISSSLKSKETSLDWVKSFWLMGSTLRSTRLWHMCFPVNFVKFLRTPFLQDTSGRLLLSVFFNRLRLKLEWTIWWWQFGCNNAWTPEFTDRFGWWVKIKSIQEELLACICVGSFITVVEKTHLRKLMKTISVPL